MKQTFNWRLWVYIVGLLCPVYWYATSILQVMRIDNVVKEKKNRYLNIACVVRTRAPIPMMLFNFATSRVIKGCCQGLRYLVCGPMLCTAVRGLPQVNFYVKNIFVLSNL